MKTKMVSIMPINCSFMHAPRSTLEGVRGTVPAAAARCKAYCKHVSRVTARHSIRVSARDPAAPPPSPAPPLIPPAHDVEA